MKIGKTPHPFGPRRELLSNAKAHGRSPHPTPPMSGGLGGPHPTPTKNFFSKP